MNGHYHDWPVTCWGVIIGLAKCKICGVRSTKANINEWVPAKTADNLSFKSDTKNVQCPVCGYYCLGRGGYGCIDKPSIVFRTA